MTALETSPSLPNLGARVGGGTIGAFTGQNCDEVKPFRHTPCLGGLKVRVRVRVRVRVWVRATPLASVA
jgi:hypothetical protein